MARIFWTAAEKKEVAEASFAFREDMGFTGTDLECVREAMRSCIRPDRHRNLNTMVEVPWVYDAWVELKRSTRQVPNIPAAIQPIVSPKVERESTPQFSLGDVSITDLFMELSKRVEAIANPAYLRTLIRAEVNATIDRRLPGIVPPDLLDQPEVPKKRIVIPKVAVIGLMGAQQNMLRDQYRDKVDFYFLEGKEGMTRIKNTAQSMDLTIKSRWCKGLLGSTKELEKFQATTGGLDQIRAIINRTFDVEAVK